MQYLVVHIIYLKFSFAKFKFSLWGLINFTTVLKPILLMILSLKGGRGCMFQDLKSLSSLKDYLQ
jgi:hypothetical protein